MLMGWLSLSSIGSHVEGECGVEVSSESLSDWSLRYFNSSHLADSFWVGLSRTLYLGSTSAHTRKIGSWSELIGSVNCFSSPKRVFAASHILHFLKTKV